MTHPRQSTVSPILEPVSSSKRQALQRKPFALSPVPTQTSSRLRTHGTSVPSTPQSSPTTATPSPQTHVIRLPENSTPPTNVAIPTFWFQRLKGLHGNYVRHFSATTPNAPQKLHVIPPGPHSSTARKPRNINDPISKPETSSRELRAKLLRLRSQGQDTHAYARPEAAEPRLQRIRIGNKHPDR